MKNLEFFLLAIMLSHGIGSAIAQTKSTVIITGENPYGVSKYEIEIVKPDYVTEKKELTERTDPFLASMKKEVDVWLNKGYEITGVTSSTVGTNGERLLFVLIKEE